MTSFVALDVETANESLASICQIGVVRFEGGQEVAAQSWLIDPCDYFASFNIGLHGIDEEAVRGCPEFWQVLPELLDFVGGDMVACHSAFDRNSIRAACALAGLAGPGWAWLNTVRVARRAWTLPNCKLVTVADHLGIAFRHHDALEDARVAGLLLTRAIAETGIELNGWPDRVELPVSGIAPSRIKLAGSDDGLLSGECVVMTGTLSKTKNEIGAFANGLGAAVESGVTKRTTILIVGVQDLGRTGGQAKSAKHRKADDLRAAGSPIRILSEPDFMALV